MTHHYRLFGLTFASEPEIAGLEPARIAAVDRPDVQIRLAGLEAQPDVAEFLGMPVKGDPARLFFEAPEVARFQVSEGREILVDTLDGDLARARDHLLGTALGAVLHQRGYLPLHANVMAWNGRAYAFAGVSGAGKSTLAARLHARGYGFMSDDICAVSWDAEGRPRAWPGIPRVKLWRDALSEIPIDAALLRPLSWTTEKFEAPVSYQAGAGSLPLAAVYDLREEQEGAPRGVHPLAGVDAVNTLVAHTYRRRLTDFQGTSSDYLRRVLGLARSTRVLELRRRWGFDEFEHELGAIHDSILSIDRSAGSSAETHPASQ